jgi:hypothetical protein
MPQYMEHSNRTADVHFQLADAAETGRTASPLLHRPTDKHPVHPAVDTDYTILSYKISWEHTQTRQALTLT